MRYRVDTLYGCSVSWDEADEAKAREMYASEGIHLVLCEDLSDRGVLLEGVPLAFDMRKMVRA